MQICPVTVDDIRSIEQIENSALSPWSQALISDELQAASSLQLLVHKRGRKDIIGWCCARLLAPEAELLKITVLPHYRRSEAGTLLLRHLINRCGDAECSSLFVEVRANNKEALHFYQKNEFRPLGKRKKYYSDPTDDAILLQRNW